MILYRITNAKYAKDFSGIGARLFGGRWNSEGRSAVYLASSRSLAILESLVHIVPTNVPDELLLLTLETPDDYVEIEPGWLPPDWKDESKSNILQYIGNSFLQRNEHLLLKVPSVIVPEEYNYLMNPLHPKSNKVKIVKSAPFNFDERLL